MPSRPCSSLMRAFWLEPKISASVEERISAAFDPRISASPVWPRISPPIPIGWVAAAPDGAAALRLDLSGCGCGFLAPPLWFRSSGLAAEAHAPGEFGARLGVVRRDHRV